jgi:naphthalene 1,2-dioxygenase system ferredoxin subunit
MHKLGLKGDIDLAAEADLFEVAGIVLTQEGQDIALFSVEGAVLANSKPCTHGNDKLCDGLVKGDQVECPFHQVQLSLRDGSVACGPATEPVKIEGERGGFLQLTA